LIPANRLAYQFARHSTGFIVTGRRSRQGCNPSGERQCRYHSALPATIESVLADLKPEAAYFAEENGKRTAFVFFDLKDASQIPAVAEPWFLAFHAHIELRPAMNLEDLKKAGIEKAVKNYRRGAHTKAA
jgi:hypothetical protein